MTTRLFRAPLRGVLVQAAAVCCLLAAGCEGGPGGKSGWPELRNPFAGSTKASPEKEAEEPTRVGPDFVQGMARARDMEKSAKLMEAREIYQDLIVKYPRHYEPYHRLAVVADRQKRYREAQALYTQAVSLHASPELFNDLGYCLYLQGKLDKAESALLKAVSMMPANARFRNNLGMVYGYQGRDEEAMEQLRHGGSEADAFYNMAVILTGRDDVAGARDCLRLALAADPTHKRAQDALKSLESPEHEEGDFAGGDPLVKDGRRWEPYVEGSRSQAGLAQAASYEAPGNSAAAKDSGRIVPSTRPDTQALLRRARTMMSERIAEQGAAP